MSGSTAIASAITGSVPGNDGEGIVCRPAMGTQVLSWGDHAQYPHGGNGSAGGLGGLDADCGITDRLESNFWLGRQFDQNGPT